MKRSPKSDESRLWPKDRKTLSPDNSDRIQRLQKCIADLRAEKERLEEENQVLKHDSAFNMLTRNAFIQLCRFMPRGVRVFAVLDFDRLKESNSKLGYEEVNRRIRKTFSSRRKSDVVARWFSGDEILILFDGRLDGARTKMRAFEDEADRNGLKFTYEFGTWVVASEPIEAAVERVAQRLLERKSIRDDRPTISA